MSEKTYVYSIVQGPRALEVAASLFAGMPVKFTVWQEFGENLEECWEAVLDEVGFRKEEDRYSEIFKIRGRVVASGSSWFKLDRNIGLVVFSGIWNTRERGVVGSLEVTVFSNH